MKKFVKLAKSTYPGNKDGNLEKKAKLINLVNDFHKQYDSLHYLYESMRGDVKKHVEIRDDDDDDNSSSATADSESYYSLEESNIKGSENSIDISKVPVGNTDELGIKDAKSKSTSQSLARIRELEQEVKNLKLQTAMIGTEKNKLEEKSEHKANESAEIEVKVSRLVAQISESELKLKEKESQFSSARKQFDIDEQQYISRISDLSAKANSFQVEVRLLKSKLEDSLCSESIQKSRVKGLLERVDFLEKELAARNSKKAELELDLKKKSQETSEFLNEIENLRNEMTRKVTRKGGREIRVKDLEQEIHSLTSSKSDLEEQVKKINQEAFRTNFEKEELHKKISDLQTAVSEKENYIFTVQEKFKASEIDMSAQIKYLTEEVRSVEHKMEALNDDIKILQVELDSSRYEKERLCIELEKEKHNSFQLDNEITNLTTMVVDQQVNDERKILQVELEYLRKRKEQLEMELDKEKQECSRRSQLAKENVELINKITDQKKTINELGGEINKLADENKQAQSNLAASKLNVQHAVKKMEEKTAEIQKQFEAQYRILTRRIRIAEQLHAENKDLFTNTRDMYEKEKRELLKKVDASTYGIESIKDMSLKANDIIASLDSLTFKFEQGTTRFLNRLSKSSCDMKFFKDWVTKKNNTLLQVKDEFGCVRNQLDDKEAEILASKEKVKELEKIIQEKEDQVPDVCFRGEGS